MGNKNNISVVENIDSLPNLYSDADGVCLNLSSTFHRFMFEEFGHKAIVDEPENFNFSDAYPDVKEPHKRVLDFFSSKEWTSRIQAYPEAKAAFLALKNAGKKVRIVTSCGQLEATKNGRIECLEREFGDCISDVVFVEYGQSKRDVLSNKYKFPPGKFVDDLPEHCLNASGLGHEVFLLSRNYNRGFDSKLLPSDSKRVESIFELPYFS